MPNKNVRKMRGPSRPIDPRYAPSPVAKKRSDTFGVWLVGTFVVFVLVIILWVSVSQGNNNNGTTAGTVSTPVSQTVDQSALATQQALSVATQVIQDATETATLPRIEPKDAIAEYNAGNVKIVDVRARDAYLGGHVKG